MFLWGKQTNKHKNKQTNRTKANKKPKKPSFKIIMIELGSLEEKLQMNSFYGVTDTEL